MIFIVNVKRMHLHVLLDVLVVLKKGQSYESLFLIKFLLIAHR